jgi:Flp pilus assembly protein TadD
VLDQARSAAAKDPDLLYRIAHMYELVNQSQTTEEVLQQVVKLDPNHASACNDLGYSWADQGKNLDRAESLIRIAVAQEPDNQSFLDSLGWVLYKRGQYDQALTELQRAVGPAPQPDPVVLDHLGDVLYRLGRTDDATRQWERSLSGLGDPSQGGDPAFRQQLEQKLLQRRRNQPVTVAPTGDAK